MKFCANSGKLARVILNGGEAGVRDLDESRMFVRSGRGRQGACSMGVLGGRQWCCTRIVGSLGGLAPSSG